MSGMGQQVTAIFDIGKTNKKFFLFDRTYHEVYREYARFEEIEDEDGFPTEDLKAIQQWMMEVFNRMLDNGKFDIVALNFSTYGATLVHLDQDGNVLTPLYNYLKPLVPQVLLSFEKKYVLGQEFYHAIGSGLDGMLNSGLQLYWLKYWHPEVFKKIKYSLHLPQYLSYLFTGVPQSDYTSIGCHTALWDYQLGDYHSWVYQEKIDQILPPIVPTESSLPVDFNGKIFRVGTGIHDSSSSLLPYIAASEHPFVLLSTGTWNVVLNPFSRNYLLNEGIGNDGVCYLSTRGQAVVSSKLLMGKELDFQVSNLRDVFNSADNEMEVPFDEMIFQDVESGFDNCFNWKYLTALKMPSSTFTGFTSYGHAYHRLILELVVLQWVSIDRVKSKNDLVKTLFVDGGFGNNEVFIQILARHAKGMKIKTSEGSLGSAVGAAMIVFDPGSSEFEPSTE
jgi:sugar (pentulose or hexulose) kinase